MSSSLPEFKRRNEEHSSKAERSVGKFGRMSDRRGSSRHASGRTYELTLGQMLILWSVMAGSLCVAFLFGLFAGREQGVTIALDEYQRQATRLPIVEPLANLGASERLPNVADEISKPKATEAPVLVDAGKPAGKMDFSAESKLPLPSRNPVSVKKEVKASVAKAKAQVSKTPAIPVPVTVPAVVEAPKAAVAKAATPNVNGVISSPVTGWYVQVGASPELSKAEGIAAKLASLKVPVVLEKAFVQKKRYFRVLVGPFPNKEKAASQRTKILKSKKISVTPFLKRVR